MPSISAYVYKFLQKYLGCKVNSYNSCSTAAAPMTIPTATIIIDSCPVK